MISTGMTGTPRQGIAPNSASRMRVKTLLLRRAAAGEDRLARAAHVRRLGIVADHLQREIGLHAGADVEVAAVEQRPAAMRALDAAQIGGDLALEFEILGSAEIMAAAGHIRPGSWRRPRVRTPMAVAHAGGPAAPRSPG